MGKVLLLGAGRVAGPFVQYLLDSKKEVTIATLYVEDAEALLQPSAPSLGDINALFDEAGIGVALRRQAERISDIYRH